MGKSRDGTVTPHYYRTLKGRKLSTICYRCGDPIMVGDEYHSMPSNNYTIFKLFHRNCWENQYIDVQDDPDDEEEFIFTQPQTETIIERTKTITERTQTEVKATT